ncbi:hypothetical protein [Pontibacter chinhatensis]|uniref:O-Antigen ligase n=1 Tax=Pontibacter chinhatensis TaxID=1436961 RepID=A0A1I2WZ10_9BACT|nr:hypothetical protein [Pontibacter chinhatensis]SFH06530.1 hypothetical protein SAMN05421739_105284 [Pontibacter chinhatensis]
MGNDIASSGILKHPVGNVWDQGARLLYNTEVSSNSLLKRVVWAYILLLIFEGALRKWILPELATPLLIVRDPLALWLLFKTWERGQLPANNYLTTMVLVGVLGIFTAAFLGHGSLAVAIYGARVYLLHLPLIFVVGRVFTYQDVVLVGKFLLWLAVPMTVLITLQFYSPQSAWVNRGVGGDLEGAGFGGALGFFRPPGTFSFTNGNTLYYSLLGCFVLYFWMERRDISRILLICASVCLIAAIPLSISRGLFFQAGVTVIFALFAISHRPKFFKQFLGIMIGGTFTLLFLSNVELFQTATEAFSARYESANTTEGGLQGVLGDRYIGGMVNSVAGSTDFPFWGYGIGFGSNVGLMLLPGMQGARISDQEWERIIIELGTIMGLIVIFLRINLSIKIAVASYKSLVQGNLLPWMILSLGFLNILQAQWAQPTSLGFSVLIGGLMIAALRRG